MMTVPSYLDSLGSFEPKRNDIAEPHILVYALAFLALVLVLELVSLDSLTLRAGRATFLLWPPDMVFQRKRSFGMFQVSRPTQGWTL